MAYGWAFLVLAAAASDQALALLSAEEPGALKTQFVVSANEDGQPMPGLFELWDWHCRLGKRSSTTNPSCTLTAVSFVTQAGVTFVRAWPHMSQSVHTEGSGTYRVQFGGRGNNCSGLEAVVRVDDGLKVRDITATMRTGPQCDSVRAFCLNSIDMTVPVAPLFNPGYRPAK
jgi:hypothetical protein